MQQSGATSIETSDQPPAPAPAGAGEGDLDPRSPEEWEEVRRAGYRLVDQLVARHQALRGGPCWRPTPPEVKAELGAARPGRSGLGLDAAMRRAERLIQPHGTGNLNPRFWGWVLGAGSLPGILGQWMAAGMNANVFAGDQGPVHLELAVLEWFRSWFGFPPGSSGILVDGGSMANVMALAIARHRATGGQVKEQGAEVMAGLRIYGSAATHNSVVKGAELLGLGSRAFRAVETAPDGRADVEALEEAIAADRRAGLRPFCLVGSAGTVGTGAVDPLDRLRQLADRHGLWLHVDGAIGALGWISERLRPRLAGLDRADSLAFDLHKWGQVPYDASCLLVRDGELHRAAFTVGATYLGAVSGGFSAHGSHAFNERTPLLSRPDRALKIWMTFMALGTDRIAAVFEKNAAQAQELAARIERERELELLAPVGLNIVCWRYRAGLPEGEPLDRLNERILVELQESGFCVMSPYRMNGRFCLRVAISNHRTRSDDLEALVERVLEAGRRLEG